MVSTLATSSSEKKCGHPAGRCRPEPFVHCPLPDAPTSRSRRPDRTRLCDAPDERRRRATASRDGRANAEGFYRITPGIGAPIVRALAYAPYADVLWCETSTPDLDEAAQFAEAVHAQFPGKLLAYNCSPSFNWKKHLDDATIASFQRELAAMGYKFQFVTLAGFHAVCNTMFDLARGYAAEGMSAYVRLQQGEFANEEFGYTATRHQREVGVGYFDAVLEAVSGGQSSTLALKGSTEEAQFDVAATT